MKEKIKSGYPFTLDTATAFMEDDGVYGKAGNDWWNALGSSTGTLSANEIVKTREELFLINPILIIDDHYTFHREIPINGILARMNEALFSHIFRREKKDIEKNPILDTNSVGVRISNLLHELGYRETQLERVDEKDIANLEQFGLAHPFKMTAKVEKEGKVFLGRLVA